MQELPIIDAIKNNLKIEQIPIHKVRYHEKNEELFQRRNPEYIRELANNIQRRTARTDIGKIRSKKRQLSLSFGRT
ncbi:hypothetical protein LEP1GSC168_0101 [Leptospira santarosai str. HAI134]|nr:hypothetical protein LEP1GSC168_0101 [Leptospira santarosai str. HAI134]